MSRLYRHPALPGRALAVCAVASVLLSATSSLAQEIEAVGEPARDAVAPMGSANPQTSIAATPLSAASLDDLYGTGASDAASVAVSDQMLQASDTGNALISGGAINSGALTLSGGAFGNFNGVGNFVFNTGNNNTLQGSINITVLTPSK